MPKYNLDALGPQEFERLCQALAQAIIGPGVKVYGMGSDGSREATFRGKAPYPSTQDQWDGSWIFQAKFHDVQQIGPRKARRHLLAELDDELLKITGKHRQPCDNYILMTNVSLTPVFQKGTKDKINNEIIPKYSPIIKNIDVWGAEEICRFLDAYSNIRQTYVHFLVAGDVIARLLKIVEEVKTDLDELVKLYCQGCFIHEQYAALDDAGDVEDERVALQRVFVDLNVKPPTLPEERPMLEKFPEWLRQAAEDKDRTSALSYLLDDCIPGLVLIGGPGSGKSTLGQYLAQIHRARLIGRLNELNQGGNNIEYYESCIPRLAFGVLLREYAQWIASQKTHDSLFNYIAFQVSQESGSDTKPENVQRIVKSNPTLLILDGLDEVPEKNLRRKVIDNITSFVHQVRDVLGGDLRVIATTRPYGYTKEFDPAYYLHLTLQKLEPSRAVNYAKRWINAREPISKEAGRVQSTFNLCLEDRVVSVLMQTPLQITILLVIIRARGTPPKQCEELFECYMGIIYQREQKKGPELLRTELHIIYGLHKYLAYILHRRAEKDRTAALMDISGFEEKVKEYLVYTNPLLDREELKTKVNQIITEASQRLVLIESPQAGKIGFGLPVTREFFTAAHLVDTAKNTKERDARFKAIARSPYWRNVALFFAGRVGRTRPGEAPSMIDVCREIDTEGADNFLKRGADLVMEIIDDRALREPHNEIGAIQYTLEMLDTGFIKDLQNWLNKLKSLPEEYKERVIHPWIEERLANVRPENLELYTEAYQNLFGFRKPVEKVIKRALECDSKDVRLWAMSKAIENRIIEPWVTDLLEELVNVLPMRKIAGTLRDYLYNFRPYLNLPLSSRARTIFALALLLEAGKRPPFESLHSKPIKELSEIKAEDTSKENFLFMWAVSNLLMLWTLGLGERHKTRDYPVELFSPGIADPNLRTWVNKKANFIEKFCKTFFEEKEPLTNTIVKIFGFLLKPNDLDKFIEISRNLHGENVEENGQWVLIRILASLMGRFFEDEEKLREYHEDIYRLYKRYESKDAYIKDFEKLNELINKRSANVSNHPHRFLIWIDSGYYPVVEKSLDSELLNDLRTWLKYSGLPKHILPLCLWAVEVKSDLELCELALEVLENQLTEEQKQLTVFSAIGWYRWHKPDRGRESTVASRLRDIFERVLANYPSLTQKLDILYCAALAAGVIEEGHMIKLYEIAKNYPRFPWGLWYGARAEKTLPYLMDMLKSDDLGVVRLAAASLSTVLESRFSFEKERLKEVWVGEKLWELARNKEDAWQSIYLKGMAQCRLKWAKRDEEWLEAIKRTYTEELQCAWGKVIKEAGYGSTKDRDALFNLLLRILGSRDSFPKSVHTAAFKRVHEIVYEVKALEFDEALLNLPLSRR